MSTRRPSTACPVLAFLVIMSAVILLLAYNDMLFGLDIQNLDDFLVVFGIVSIVAAIAFVFGVRRG